MARTKKNIKKEVEEKKTIEEISVEKTDNINYQGSIKVSVQHGNKTISTKTYHNAGCSPLFKAICNALGGNFYKDQLPKKIALFDGRNETYDKNTKITPYIYYDTTPVIKEADNKTCSVMFHFRIPYAVIDSSKIEICKAAIYSENPGGEDDKLAYYEFKDNGSWSPITILSTAAKNYSLIIEWTMTIGNKE